MYEVIIISKKMIVGTCALCKEPNMQLRASHLIPKLAYNRTKSTKKSRFRAINDIKHPLQDGEKKYLLCDRCEEFFSAFESQFTNFFLDDFLKTQKISKKITKEQWFLNYMLSVVWRIVYDDLYNAGSFVGNTCRTIFEECERHVRNYLNSLMDNKNCISPHCRHYVYKIDEIMDDIHVIKFLEPTLFGYCYFDGEYQIPMVITYYLGIVFVTVFENEEVLYIDSLKKTFYRKYGLSKIVRNIVSTEIKAEAIHMATMYENNMTTKLYEKIKDYYDNN